MDDRGRWKRAPDELHALGTENDECSGNSLGDHTILMKDCCGQGTSYGHTGSRIDDVRAYASAGREAMSARRGHAEGSIGKAYWVLGVWQGDLPAPTGRPGAHGSHG